MPELGDLGGDRVAKVVRIEAGHEPRIDVRDGPGRGRVDIARVVVVAVDRSIVAPTAVGSCGKCCADALDAVVQPIAVLRRSNTTRLASLVCADLLRTLAILTHVALPGSLKVAVSATRRARSARPRGNRFPKSNSMLNGLFIVFVFFFCTALAIQIALRLSVFIRDGLLSALGLLHCVVLGDGFILVKRRSGTARHPIRICHGAGRRSSCRYTYTLSCIEFQCTNLARLHDAVL